MTKSEAMEKLEVGMVRERLLYRTQQTYRGCVMRFLTWAAGKWSANTREQVVSDYLGEHAGNWSAATQNQALNAIVFFFKKAIEKPLGELPQWTYAQRSKRLPVWLSHDEAFAVLGQMSGLSKLACQLMYGAGLRISEVTRLRRRDINWSEAMIVVRDGKGEKDRVTCLPISLISDLRAQDSRAAAQWQEDRDRNVDPVWMPDCMVRKYPKSGLEEGNFWLLPSAGLAQDKQWGRVRHHIHPDTLSKAIPVAARRARVLKHVKAHVFRHSFATEYLMQGGVIHDLQALLGHTTIETTQIYLHCLPKLAARITSPLDRVPGNVVQFDRTFTPSVNIPEPLKAVSQ